MSEREYTFDCKLFATARVKAASESEARAKLLAGLEYLELFMETENGVSVSSACIEDDSGAESELVEIDGEAV